MGDSGGEGVPEAASGRFGSGAGVEGIFRKFGGGLGPASAQLRRRNCQLQPVRLRWPTRMGRSSPLEGRSSPLGYAGEVEAAYRCSGRVGRLGQLGFAEAIDPAAMKSPAKKYSKTLCSGRDSL